MSPLRVRVETLLLLWCQLDFDDAHACTHAKALFACNVQAV